MTAPVGESPARLGRSVRARVIWNPGSGSKGGIATNRVDRAGLEDALRRHGYTWEIAESGSAGEARAQALGAVRDGYDLVVAAGGDGTIGTIAGQLVGTATALGVLPLGSVMNIPRMLGVPRDLDEAARILAEGYVRSIDVGQVGDRIFFEAGSVGMHAAATRELPEVDRGDYGAIARSIAALFRYRPTEMRLELDGDRTIETKALLVAVANGPFMGPGATIAPEALLNDGLFDVRVFLDYTKGELVRYLASIAFGHRTPERRSQTVRARWIRITSGRPLPVRADAQDLGTTPVVFEVRPRVLTVVAPDPSLPSSGSARYGPHLPMPGRGVAATPSP